jgi:hypothetical protein
MNHRELDDWKLVYTAWRPEEQALREALCTLGNGYFATRGAFEEVNAGGVHYPGTYVAGGYNRLESEVAGRIIENEDLVNWPNWLCLTFRVDEGEWFDIESVSVESFRQTLDLKMGVLERRVRFRDSQDRVTLLESRRIVHMANPHLAAIEWRLTPENWSGAVEIRSALDGTVINDGVKRYRGLSAKHLEVDVGVPPRAGTAKPTAATSSGTSSSSSPCSTGGCRKSPGGCSCTATSGWTPPAPRRGQRISGGHVPVAERQRRARGKPEAPPQSALRPLDSGQQPSAAACERGDRLQYLPVLSGVAGHGIPGILRGGNDS